MIRYLNNAISQFKDLEKSINKEIKSLSQNKHYEFIFKGISENEYDYGYNHANKIKVEALLNNLRIDKKFNFIIDRDNSSSTLILKQENKDFNNNFSKIELEFGLRSEIGIKIKSVSSEFIVNEELALSYIFSVNYELIINLKSLKSNRSRNLYFNINDSNEENEYDDEIVKKYMKKFIALLKLSNEKENFVYEYLFTNKNISKEEKELLQIINDIDIEKFEGLRIDLKLNENKKIKKIKNI